MATHSSVLAWRIPVMGEPGGCRLWGRTESDTTEATQQQQQQQQQQQCVSIIGKGIQFSVLQQDLIDYFIYRSVYTSIPTFQFIPPSAPFPPSNHRLVFHICDSVSVLQISSVFLFVCSVGWFFVLSQTKGWRSHGLRELWFRAAPLGYGGCARHEGSRQENCTQQSQVAEPDRETGHALSHGGEPSFARLGGDGGKVAKNKRQLHSCTNLFWPQKINSHEISELQFSTFEFSDVLE